MHAPLPAAESPTPPGITEALVRSVLTGMLSELRPDAKAPLDLDAPLETALGLDSLSRVELLARIERQAGIRLPDDALERVRCARDLLTLNGITAPRTTAPLPQDPDKLPQTALIEPPAADTLNAIIDWYAERHPARPHIVFLQPDGSAETLTCGALRTDARRVATALMGQGIGKGDTVALMLPSGPAFFRCFAGIVLAGATPVPLYPPARPEQIADHLRRQRGILDSCEARLLVTTSEARLLSGKLPQKVLTPDELLAGAEPATGHAQPERPETTTGDLALIQYTSGSTGNPKGVALSHANLLANIRAWGETIRLRSDDVCVSWLPLYHDMGLIGAWMGNLVHGSRLILMSPLDFLARPERWLQAIQDWHGTISAAPNFAYELCLRRIDDTLIEQLDLSSWRLAANGAEAVNASTIERFRTRFACCGFRPEALTPVYGLAECALGLAVPPPGRLAPIDTIDRQQLMTSGFAAPCPASSPSAQSVVGCGQALPGHQIRIVDDTGQVLPDRHEGHLEFRGPSATRGYHRNPAASAALIRNGWHDSGDLGYLVAGEVYLTGRSRDLIIRGGHNIHPEGVEAALGTISGLRRGCVAVFGATDPELGTERMVVVAETRVDAPQARTALSQQISTAVAELLGTPPDVVALVAPHSILKTSSGKIRRAATCARWLEGSLGMHERTGVMQTLRLAAAYALWRSDGWRRRLRQAADALLGGLLGSALLLLLLPTLLLPGLDRRWFCLHHLARPLAHWLARPLRQEGMSASGRCLYIANHASYSDVLFLLACLPAPPRALCRQT